MRSLLRYSFLLLPFVLLGCSSGGSRPPAGPVTELSIGYCRVELASFEMHAQWATDHAAAGEVQFGRSSYSDTVRVSAYADSQDVALPGLLWSTGYVYRVVLHDSAGHSAECNGTFTTPDKAAPEPVIVAFQMAHITESTARLSWRTDEPATTVLRYGDGTNFDSVVNDALSIEHRVTLRTLEPLRLYTVRAEGVDSSGLRGIGGDTTLTTGARMILSLPDTTLALGDTVRVPIVVDNAIDLAALRLTLDFTPGSLEILALDEGPFYSARGGFLFFRDIRNSTGRLVADLAWSITYEDGEAQGTAAGGAGVVAYATLRGVSPGVCALGFDADSSFALDIFALQHACSLRAAVD